jgi:hypothetical protein
METGKWGLQCLQSGSHINQSTSGQWSLVDAVQRADHACRATEIYNDVSLSS